MTKDGGAIASGDGHIIGDVVAITRGAIAGAREGGVSNAVEGNVVETDGGVLGETGRGVVSNLCDVTEAGEGEVGVATNDSDVAAKDGRMLSDVEAAPEPVV